VSTVQQDMWGHPEEAAPARDFTGWSIEAADGGIGKVDSADNETGARWLIVDTGPWIFGKRVMQPAGVVDRINSEDQVLHVNRTKEQIKNAPELVEGRHPEHTYRDELVSTTPEGVAATWNKPRFTPVCSTRVPIDGCRHRTRASAGVLQPTIPSRGSPDGEARNGHDPSGTSGLGTGP
jgi:hypothetical protein